MRQRRVELHRERIDLFQEAAVGERLPHLALIDARARTLATFCNCQLRVTLRITCARPRNSARTRAIHIIQHHVFLHRSREDLKVLEYRADRVAIRLDVILPHIHTIRQDPPRRRIVKTHQELDQRGLARAVIADERDLLTRVHLHRNIRQYPRETFLIGKAHTLEGKCFCRRRRNHITFRNHLRLVCQKVADLLDIKARLTGLRIGLGKDTKAPLEIRKPVKEHDQRRQRDRVHHRVAVDQIARIERIRKKPAANVILQKSHTELLFRQ